MVNVRDKGNVSLHLSHLRVLVRLHTAQHKVAIFRHQHLGRVLVLDEEIQHVEKWAPLYHEPLVHLAAAFVEKPRTALLLGGGSFFAAQELLRYKSIKRLLMLDHDLELIETVKKFYEHAERALRDDRLEVRGVDAFAALSTLQERFDLVVNDSVDLFRTRGPRIFSSMARLLNPQGVCSDLIYRHIFDDLYLNSTIGLLHSTYRTVLSLVLAPDYAGVLHLLTIWGKTTNLDQGLRTTVNSEQRKWVASPGTNPCVYFDPRFLAYHLHLPRIVRQCIAKDYGQRNAFLKLRSRLGQSMSSQ